MKRTITKTKSPATKIVLWLIIILMLAVLGVGAYFITTTYFFKDQPNTGHIRFSPGIYVEFNSDSVKIDQSNYNDWRLLYYKNGDFSSTPVELNDSGELGYPTKVYNIISPEFRSAADANLESAPFVARAKLEYKDENDQLLSEEKLNYVFSQTMGREEDNGKLLEFADGWVLGSDGYYYYVGTNTFETLNKDSLFAIEYSADAEYIKIFKTNENNVAQIKLANQSPENYQEQGISEIKIVLTMDFVEVGSDTIDSWFTPAP